MRQNEMPNFKGTVTVAAMTPGHITVKPTPGETWYYKLPKATHLSRGWISDVTEHTVEIRNSEWATCNTRYKLSDLEFVEQVRDCMPELPPYPGAKSLSDYITKVQQSENQK